MSHKKERMLSAVKHAVAEFIGRESNRVSLMTVTNARIADNGDDIEIYVSVLPKEETGRAIEFLDRRRLDLSQFLKKRVTMRSLPKLVFLPDPALGSIEEPREA